MDPSWDFTTPYHRVVLQVVKTNALAGLPVLEGFERYGGSAETRIHSLNTVNHWDLYTADQRSSSLTRWVNQMAGTLQPLSHFVFKKYIRCIYDMPDMPEMLHGDSTIISVLKWLMVGKPSNPLVNLPS